jgi:hypothetical protein
MNARSLLFLLALPGLALVDANARSGARAVSSAAVAPADAELALAVGKVVAELVRRLPIGFDDLKGAGVSGKGCDAPGTKCWKSTVTLPATGDYAAVAHIAEVSVAMPKGSLRYRVHGIELARSAQIGESTRSLFASAVALELKGFQAEKKGANTWCRPIDERRTDLVEVAGNNRKLEISVQRMEFPEPQSGACFNAAGAAKKSEARGAASGASTRSGSAPSAPNVWIGAQVQDLTEQTAVALGRDETKGAFVVSVVEGAPAAKAGLARGDLVLALDGDEIPGAAALIGKIAALKPGTKARLKIYRSSDASAGGGERTVTLTVEERPAGR